MFQYPPPKRHPLHTFEFWFIVVLGVGLIGAWQLGLITSPQPQPATVADGTFDGQKEVEEATSVLRTRPVETEAMPASANATSDATEGTWPDFDATTPRNDAPADSLIGAAPLQTESEAEVDSFRSVSSETTTAANDSPEMNAQTDDFVGMQINPAPPQDEPVPQANAAPLSQFRFAQNVEEPETPSVAATMDSRNGIETITPVDETEGTRVRLVAATPQDLTTAEPEFTPAEPQPLAPPVESHFDFAQIDAWIEDGDEITAHRTLSTWFWKQPEHRAELMDRLNMLAAKIYFHPQPHYMGAYTVEPGDRLESIAKAYNVSWEYLAKLNRTDPQRIRAGQALKVIQGPFSAVIDLSDFQITIHAHGYYVTSFPCGIGKDGTTPIGTFKVTDKLVDPTYYGPDGVIKCDDPTNPLGKRWIAIGDEAGQVQGYGIHGTIDPASIGKAESRGCIRLGDRDVENVYDFLTVGSEVVIRR